MTGIKLKLTEEKAKLPVGVSKFMGNPDVWNGLGAASAFEWPHFTEKGEEYDLTFLCQLNLAEFASLDAEHSLPGAGMLYFFYDMDEMPGESSDPRAVRVIYYDGELSELHEMLRTDHEGNDMSLQEMKIDLDPDQKNSKGVLTLGASPKSKLQLILQIQSFETEKLKIYFDNGSVLCFYVEKTKLENKDFSKVTVRQFNKNEALK